MDSRPTRALFVYGSLKRGGGNSHWLTGALWQGRARLAGYRLHSLGNYPMAVPGRGVVHGEVYAVNDTLLARLDQLEDVPVNTSALSASWRMVGIAGCLWVP